MTLIEVVASLALLGVLLGSAVVAKSRLNRQWSAAQQRAEAVAALDAQLTVWRGQADTPPLADAVPSDQNAESTAWPTSGEGPLTVEPWWWRAEVVTQEQEVLPVGLQVVRYIAYRPGTDRNVRSQIGRTRPAATLDVWLYQPITEEDSGGEL